MTSAKTMMLTMMKMLILSRGRVAESICALCPCPSPFEERLGDWLLPRLSWRGQRGDVAGSRKDYPDQRHPLLLLCARRITNTRPCPRQWSSRRCLASATPWELWCLDPLRCSRHRR